ncbi:hypothetical protein [Xinfangfangia pollutisoli]|uniref:hypothetical protein n=1 Tax=Xinfangfangia pollutisoli TaxID=2865960 RepID=UPI001CD3918E|nr:hypothetical protein [Xinfangfangia pollutisoli]
MAYTYTYPPNAVLETGKPARAVDIRAIRDIGPAIAEGAAGAPRIARLAMSGKDGFLGLLKTQYGNYVALVGLEAVARIEGLICGLTGITNLRVSFTVDGGESWSAYQQISVVAASEAGIGWAFFDLDSGDWLIGRDTGSFALPAGRVNGIRIASWSNTSAPTFYMQIAGGRA